MNDSNPPGIPSSARPGTLRLGTHGLPPSETLLVQSLLRLTAYNREVCWTHVGQPPYDALILDDDDSDLLSLALGPQIPFILRLTPINAGCAPGTMERPIRSEQLFHWLDQVEAEINHGKAGSAITTQSAAINQDRLEPVLHDPMIDAQAAAHAPDNTPASGPSATFSTQASRDTLLQDLSSSAPRLHLRHWPPAHMLRESTDRTRMTTLLSQRALNAQDLHRLTGLDAVECLVFMKILSAGDLLVASPAEEQQQREQTARETKARQRTTERNHRVTQQLVRGLRKRLGL